MEKEILALALVGVPYASPVSRFVSEQVFGSRGEGIAHCRINRGGVGADWAAGGRDGVAPGRHAFGFAVPPSFFFFLFLLVVTQDLGQECRMCTCSRRNKRAVHHKLFAYLFVYVGEVARIDLVFRVPVLGLACEQIDEACASHS